MMVNIFKSRLSHNYFLKKMCDFAYASELTLGDNKLFYRWLIVPAWKKKRVNLIIGFF
jgi:hypothetical protein